MKINAAFICFLFILSDYYDISTYAGQGRCEEGSRKGPSCKHPWKIHYDRWMKKDYCHGSLEAEGLVHPFSGLVDSAGVVYSNYLEASRHCQDNCTKLATPHGHTSNGVGAMFPWDGADYWIGVEYDRTQGIYVYNDGVPMDTSWLSWSPWDTAGGHPKNGHENQNCTIINNGKWKSVPCSHRVRFICEFQMNCSDGWIYNPYVDRCNKYMPRQRHMTRGITMTYEFAIKECSRHGAIVETPRSREAESFMFDLVGRRYLGLYPGVWLGIMNIADETTWIWNDGAKMTWSYWKSTEYGNAPLQNCMYASTNMSIPRAWINTECNLQPMSFVCGKITCRFPYQSVDVSGQIPFYRKCYRPLLNERLNARQAAQFCAEDGSKSNPSRLAAPVSKLEDDILNKHDEYLFDNFGVNGYGSKWIGYAFNGELNKFQWIDNSIGYGLDPNYWKLNKINSNPKQWAKAERKCTLLRPQSVSWVPRNCDETYGVVCEREQPYVLTSCPTNVTTTALSAKLLDGYYPPVPQSQRLKCYYRHTQTMAMTYSDADKFCASIGGYIMMPKKENDVEKATNDIANSQPDWMNTYIRSPLFWIGADDIGHCYHQNDWCTPNSNTFTYLDGSNFTLNKLTWYPGQPADRRSKVGCMVVVRLMVAGSDGQLYTVRQQECFQKKNVVCQVDHNNLRAHRNFDGLTACKGGTGWYPASGDVCYHTTRTKDYSYFYTYRMCGGGNTARPRDKGQMRSLFLSRPEGISTSFIGVFYYKGAPGWKWLLKNWRGFHRGEWGLNWVPNSATNWAPGQPNPGTKDHSVTMDKNGKWISADSIWQWHASCEIPGVASLSVWRAAAVISSDEASESDRPNIENALVAMVIVVSLVLMA